MELRRPNIYDRMHAYWLAGKMMFFAALAVAVLLVIYFCLVRTYRHVDNHGDSVIEDAIGQAHASKDVIIKLYTRIYELDTTAEGYFGITHQWPDINGPPPENVCEWIRRSDSAEQEKQRVLEYMEIVRRRQLAKAKLDEIENKTKKSVTEQTKDTTPDRVIDAEIDYAVDLQFARGELEKCFTLLDKLGKAYQAHVQ